jgi:hypothetical protein
MAFFLSGTVNSLLSIHDSLVCFFSRALFLFLVALPFSRCATRPRWPPTLRANQQERLNECQREKRCRTDCAKHRCAPPSGLDGRLLLHGRHGLAVPAVVGMKVWLPLVGRSKALRLKTKPTKPSSLGGILPEGNELLGTLAGAGAPEFRFCSGEQPTTAVACGRRLRGRTPSEQSERYGPIGDVDGAHAVRGTVHDYTEYRVLYRVLYCGSTVQFECLWRCSI